MKKRDVIPDYDAAMAELAEKKKKDRAKYFDRLDKVMDHFLNKQFGNKYMTQYTPEEIFDKLLAGDFKEDDKAVKEDKEKTLVEKPAEPEKEEAAEEADDALDVESDSNDEEEKSGSQNSFFSHF